MATATTLLPAITTMNESRYFIATPQAAPSPPDSKSSSAGPMSQTPPPSSNISPTNNYHSSANHRQLRQPRQPLYVPAALRPTDSKNKSARPTDIPGRPRAPDTPPASKDSSFDSARTASPLAADIAGSPLVEQVEDDLDSMRRGLSRAASENYSVEELGDVTGAPTTAHWKPDESSPACWICNEAFTWFFRRHHCRRCGNLTCDYHIRYQVPLDQNARYHPQGTISKACQSCYDGWKVIKKLHHSRANSIAESSNSSQGTAMPIPKASRPNNDLRVGSMARSEGGMVWSTF